MALPPVGGAEGRPRVALSGLGRRQSVGLVLALAALLAGRLVRQHLLIGPDGAWRRELWLDALLEPSGPVVAEGGPQVGDSSISFVPNMLDHGMAGTDSAAADPAPPAADQPANDVSKRTDRRAGRSGKAALAAPLAINTCPADSLLLLPGVGPVLAARIDEARQAGTIFRVPEDLLAIRGIGPAAMARLTPLVRFAEPLQGAYRTHNPH